MSFVTFMTSEPTFLIGSELTLCLHFLDFKKITFKVWTDMNEHHGEKSEVTGLKGKNCLRCIILLKKILKYKDNLEAKNHITPINVVS